MLSPSATTTRKAQGMLIISEIDFSTRNGNARVLINVVILTLSGDTEVAGTARYCLKNDYVLTLSNELEAPTCHEWVIQWC